MPFELLLPAHLAAQGWKVKIHDKERNETPHVTIKRRTLAWRVSLRDLTFLDASPPSRDVTGEIIDAIVVNRDELCREWDARYPENPVSSDDDG